MADADRGGPAPADDGQRDQHERRAPGLLVEVGRRRRGDVGGPGQARDGVDDPPDALARAGRGVMSAVGRGPAAAIARPRVVTMIVPS